MNLPTIKKVINSREYNVYVCNGIEHAQRLIKADTKEEWLWVYDEKSSNGEDRIFYFAHCSEVNQVVKK